MDFNSLLLSIANRNPIDPAELLPFLCLDTVKERSEINTKLAEAYFKAKNFQQAKSFIQRAWLLSDFSRDLLPLYLEIHKSLDDITSIREAYKKLGMKSAAEQKITETINYFQLSMNACGNHQILDKYDLDVLAELNRLAKLYCFDPVLRTGVLTTRKIRLAYLLPGTLDVNVKCFIHRISNLFAKFHARSFFDVAFFVPDLNYHIIQCQHSIDNIEIIKNHGCQVVIPETENSEELIFEVANRIYSYQPDILVINTLLADLRHYFIAALRPAPIVINFNQNSPPQFVMSTLDWSIAWTKHSLIDAPCNSSLVNLEVDLPHRESVNYYSKQFLGIPELGTILISAGSQSKFQEPDFWQVLVDILNIYPDVYYIVLGVNTEIPFLNQLLIPEIKERVRLIELTEGYLEILSLADIMIDNFPSVEGVIVMDAMSLSIPVISFEHNCIEEFDQTDWSLAKELGLISDLLVEHRSFYQFKLLLAKFIKDKELRIKLGNICKEQIHSMRGNPERMVRHCENIYVKIIQRSYKKLIESSDLNAVFMQNCGTGELDFIENVQDLVLSHISIDDPTPSTNLTSLEQRFIELQNRLHKTIKFLYKSNIQIQHLQTALERLDIEFKKTQADIELSQSRIEYMEGSKFWKLRAKWLQFKQSLGFKTEG
ncbi:glycosyltransferase [Nostoc sp.]|uniref:glycosyltransferase n=1 Tax=Nostoc sp. TaxID=1180 RepID=UPI002FFA32B4